jgi:hypothetical protein
MSFADKDPDWRERIKICFREIRNVYLKHPRCVVPG